MKRLIALLMLVTMLILGRGRAQNPSFKSFDPSQFSTNNFTIRILAEAFGGTNFLGTVYITNLYVTNLFSQFFYTSNEFVTNLYVTNLYAITSITTNLTVQNLISQFFVSSNVVAGNIQGPTNRIAMFGPDNFSLEASLMNQPDTNTITFNAGSTNVGVLIFGPYTNQLSTDGSNPTWNGVPIGLGNNLWTNVTSPFALLQPSQLSQVFGIYTNGTIYVGRDASTWWGASGAAESVTIGSFIDGNSPSLAVYSVVDAANPAVQYPYSYWQVNPIISDTNDATAISSSFQMGWSFDAQTNGQLVINSSPLFVQIAANYNKGTGSVSLFDLEENDEPDNSSGHAVLMIDTFQPLTTANLLQLKNNGTNVFTVGSKNPYMTISGNTGILEPVRITNTRTNGTGIYLSYYQADNTNTTPLIASISFVPTGSWNGTAANENGLFEVNTTIAGTETPVFESRYGSVRLGKGGPATNATDGFVYFPTMNGTPTGVPRSETTSWTPLVYDKAAHKLWSNDDGTWRSVTLAP